MTTPIVRMRVHVPLCDVLGRAEWRGNDSQYKKSCNDWVYELFIYINTLLLYSTPKKTRSPETLKMIFVSLGY